MADAGLNPKDGIGRSKVSMAVLPFRVMVRVALAFMEGGGKYGRYNFRAVGVFASIYYDAAMRHLGDWWEGEDIDPASGLSHIDKAIASLIVLRDSMLQGNWTDDRPPSAAPFMDAANADAARLTELHAGRTPRHYTIKDTAP